jgi:pimeloyl-ACP methyl ester carboxylesterase
MSTEITPMPTIDVAAFHADVQYIESLWQRRTINGVDMPIIDIGEGEPLVFVPILEHLEFVYARQIRYFSRSRRVIMYRRRETRTRTPHIGLPERATELRDVLDSLGITAPADFVAHGDAAMVLFEFAARYPQRCRSLVIIAQAADYQIKPHPFIWLLHEGYLRLPVESMLPANMLRNTVVRYITTSSNKDGQEQNTTVPALPRELIEEQFNKIHLWPRVYKFSVLPVIHSFDMRQRLDALTMPILLINRVDDVLAPEAKTRWLAEHLPNCAGYHVVKGRERFFMYSNAREINRLIEDFLEQF